MQSLNINESILLEFQITKTRHPLSISEGEIKLLLNVHNMGDAHLHCVNNHYGKFEYEGINTVRVTNYTN